MQYKTSFHTYIYYKKFNFGDISWGKSLLTCFGFPLRWRRWRLSTYVVKCHLFHKIIIFIKTATISKIPVSVLSSRPIDKQVKGRSLNQNYLGFMRGQVMLTLNTSEVWLESEGLWRTSKVHSYSSYLSFVVQCERNKE